DALLDKFANRAHNDFVEVWLELGVLGAGLAGLFVLWFVMRVRHVWKRSELTSLDTLISRAATISIVLLLAHSAVDYPLRTTALLCVFALCCALLVEPYPGSWTEVRPLKRRQPAGEEARGRTNRPRMAAPVAPSLAEEWRAAATPVVDVRVPPRKAGDPAPAKTIGEWPLEWQRGAPRKADADK